MCMLVPVPVAVLVQESVQLEPFARLGNCTSHPLWYGVCACGWWWPTCGVYTRLCVSHA